MTSYLTSIDTFSLSRTVFEIFDFKVFRVWPWPLTFRDHLGSKIFQSFKSPYLTSYLTSIDIFSLSRTVFEKIRVKILRVKQNGGFWPFQGQGHRPIFFISWKGSDSHQMASIDILRVKIGSAVLAAPSSKSVKSYKKKEKKKKRTNPYMLGMCTSIRENFFRNQILLDYLGRWRNQSCQNFFQSVHSGVSGKGSNFAIFSVNRGWPLQLLYYRTTVICHAWDGSVKVTFDDVIWHLMTSSWHPTSRKWKKTSLFSVSLVVYMLDRRFFFVSCIFWVRECNQITTNCVTLTRDFVRQGHA